MSSGGVQIHGKKQIQIDIVCTSADEDAYIVESCKYRNEKVGLYELEKLRRYATIFGKGSRYYYYIFSKGGFTEELQKAAEIKEVNLLTLKDLYD